MSAANVALLAELIAREEIALRRGALLDSSPAPQAADLSFDRVEAMMLGLAIGDSLGNTSEGWLPRERLATYGEIRDYLPNEHAHRKRVGLPSDDTQLAFWALEQMLDDGELRPERVAERFTKQCIYGIGSAVKQSLGAFRSGVRPWYRCADRSAGNGALMRIAPVLIPHLRTGGADLWADAVLLALVTHNDSASLSCCVAFVSMLWQLLGMHEAPSPWWWLDAYVGVARDLETGQEYSPRYGPFMGFRGPLWRFIQEQVGAAYADGATAVEAGERWGSGAYVLETMASVLHILMSDGDDPEEAIVRAVNDTKDNDTIGAIVGAAVGALHGRDALPKRWLSGLRGRTGADDDGRVPCLIARARQRWWDDG